MAEAIFKIPTSDAAKLNPFTSDDTVSRQSITTRDGAALGLDKEVLYLRITGSDEGVAHAVKLAADQGLGKPLPAEEAAKVAQAIDAEEEAAAEGMGLIDF